MGIAPASIIYMSGPPNVGGNFDSVPSENSPTLIARLDELNVPLNGSVLDGWSFNVQGGGSIVRMTDEPEPYLRGIYPALDELGGVTIWGGYGFDSQPNGSIQDVYIQYWARMPGAKFGLKKCKLFGGQGAPGHSGYANATFGTQNNGALDYIAYGDGSDDNDENDTANGVAFYTPNYISPGRVGSLPQTIERGGTFEPSEWGTDWHKFQVRLRQNSGTTSENEINDGIVESRIDGVVRGKGINVFNRHHLNEFIKSVQIFGYTRSVAAGTSIDYKKMTVSRGGWVD